MSRELWVPWEWVRSDYGAPLEVHPYALTIKAHRGVHSQAELSTDSHYSGRCRHHDAVDSADDALPCILQGDGLFRLYDGNHRAAYRFATGKSSLKVSVEDVSPSWVADLDQPLGALYGDESLYQAIEHPWFDSWKQRRAPDRLKAVKAWCADSLNAGFLCPGPYAHALDLGSCTGAVSRLLSRFGFWATGIDSDARVVRIADRLGSVFPAAPVHYMVADIREVMKRSPKAAPPYDWHWQHWQYEVVVALSLLHHWFEQSLDDSVALLRLLGERTKSLIVDVPSVEEDWIHSAVCLADVEPAWRAALSHMDCDVLGIHDGRRMLAFRRNVR